jgi:hypothetical protein
LKSLSGELSSDLFKIIIASGSNYLAEDSPVPEAFYWAQKINQTTPKTPPSYTRAFPDEGAFDMVRTKVRLMYVVPAGTNADQLTDFVALRASPSPSPPLTRLNFNNKWSLAQHVPR